MPQTFMKTTLNLGRRERVTKLSPVVARL